MVYPVLIAATFRQWLFMREVFTFALRFAVFFVKLPTRSLPLHAVLVLAS
jgi:hypothetical protein